jgi:hypothetical protein
MVENRLFSVRLGLCIIFLFKIYIIQKYSGSAKIWQIIQILALKTKIFDPPNFGRFSAILWKLEMLVNQKMEFHVLYLVGKFLTFTMRLWSEKGKYPKTNQGRIGFESRIFKFPVFATNLAQFSQNILIILIDRNLALTVYLPKIYSLSILVLVLCKL